MEGDLVNTGAWMPLRLVLFDLDGVLCRYDVGRRVEALARLAGRRPEAVHAELWGSGFEDDADAGLYPTPEAYLEAFAARLGYPISREQWIAARRAGMSPHWDVLALAERLKREVTIGVLTNNVPLLKASLPQVFPEVPRLFGKHVFYSCDYGVKKPNPAIYRAALAELGIETAEAFFTDDKLANVEGAIEAGLAAHLFDGCPGLAAALSVHGIDVT